MTYSKTLVVLAKSKKKRALCIAGKETMTTNWVRPVKGNPFTSDELCNLANRTDPIKILDIVEMTFIEESPEVHQPENELVDMSVKWRYLGEFQVEHLEKFIDRNKNDFLDQIKNRCIHKNNIEGLNLQNSLQLIRITNSNDARIIYKQNFFHTNYKPRLRFNYRGILYNLPITDLTIPKSNRRIEPRIIENGYITIGIGEEFNNNHYLLVVMLKEIKNI